MEILRFKRCTLLVMALYGVAAADAVAAQSACLNDNLAKLCASFDAVVPADRVQPSAEGGTPTYIDYRITLKNLGPTSTRFVTFALATAPDANFVDFASSMAGCTVSGADVSCQFDKLNAGSTISFRALVQVPALAAPDQSDYPLTQTATFGWNGNTQNVSATTTVSVYGSASYVPSGQQVTLVTGPENPDRSLQTDAASPLWAKLTIPAENHGGLYASLAVVEDGPVFDCPLGIYEQTEGDIGLYVCRDTGRPQRWVETTFSEHWQFDEANPLKWELVWDTSIVPPVQLPPTPAGPTGTPPFAVFHRGGEDDAETAAYARSCATHAPPCIDTVERYGSGDWTATFLKRAPGAEPGETDNLVCLLLGCITAKGIIPPIGQGVIK